MIWLVILGIVAAVVSVGAVAFMCTACFHAGFDQGFFAGLNEGEEPSQFQLDRYEPQSEIAIAPAFEYPEPEPITAVAGIDGDWPEDDAWTEED